MMLKDYIAKLQEILNAEGDLEVCTLIFHEDNYEAMGVDEPELWSGDIGKPEIYNSDVMPDKCVII